MLCYFMLCYVLFQRTLYFFQLYFLIMLQQFKQQHNIDLPINPAKEKLNACIIISAKNLTPNYTNISELETQAIQYPSDAKQVLESLNYNVQILELGQQKYPALHKIKFLSKRIDVFLNMYEYANNTAQAIPSYFLKNGIPFIGADSFTYPNRAEMKQLCLFYGVPTTPYLFVNDYQDLKKYREVSDFPLFVKPEEGYDSVGVSENSIVRNEKDLTQRIEYIWRRFGGALLQPFLRGGEFTVLVAGSKRKCRTFPAMQYVFQQERNIISFEDKWGSNYKGSWKAVQDPQLDRRLQKIAKDLYFAAETESCARLDIRLNEATGELFVIDFNPYPTMFIEGDNCSVDNILKFSECSKRQFMQFLLDHAYERSRLVNQSHKYQVKKTKEHGMQIIAKQDIKKDELVFTDQMQPIRMVTEDYVKKNWPQQDKKVFEEYAWPVGYKVYGIWSLTPQHWRPLNHSCNPNLYVNLLSCYARRDIKKGEELNIHYSTFLSKHPQFTCWCKSKDCNGKVEYEEYKNKQFQEKFKGQLTGYIEGLVQTYNERRQNK